MRELYKIITAVLFVAWLLVMWKLPSVFSPKDIALPAEEEAPAPAATTAQNGQDSASKGNPYSETIERLKSPFPVSRYDGLVTRNIFMKPEKPPVVFSPDNLKLVSVQNIPLPFMYNGFILTANNTIIGQVSWSGKTYFVKKGGKFRDYKVIDIDKKTMAVENKDGQLLILDYQKPAKGTELIAELHDPTEEKTYEVRKDDQINEYKVLDIKTDNVVLYGQNKEWVINKER